MTLLNDDGPSNGGAEAVRVACRFWPADMKRRLELDAAIRRPDITQARDKGKANGARRPRSWVCLQCANKNVDRSWCGDCGSPRAG